MDQTQEHYLFNLVPRIPAQKPSERSWEQGVHLYSEPQLALVDVE